MTGGTRAIRAGGVVAIVGLVGLVVLVVLVGPACTPALGPAPLDPSRLPVEPAVDPWVDVAALSQYVAQIRKLPLREPVEVEALAPEAFRARIEAPALVGMHGIEPAFWDGLGFARPGVSAADATRDAAREGVAGFYDARTRTIVVAGEQDARGRVRKLGAGDLRATLAHEIEHALVDQRFALGREVPDADAALAVRALAEGDAELVRMQREANRAPLGEHWIPRLARARSSAATTDAEDDAFARRSPQMAAAPPLVRRTVRFFYGDGLAFVGDLYRAGGLGLLDRALASPPRSTEQVLHVERYLAGDAPVPVDLPTLPPGRGRASRGVLGELRAGALLAQCSTEPEAAAAASGWGGDAYAVGLDEGGAPVMLWATVWDDEPSATRFERAAAARATCDRMTPAGGRVPRKVTVLRDGLRVAYVEGLEGDAAGDAARALLRLPHEKPEAKPPFGPVTVPPVALPEDLFAHKGRWENGAWSSAPLGARLVPDAGLSPAAPLKTDELRLVDADEKTELRLRIFFQSPSEALERAVSAAAVGPGRAEVEAQGKRLELVSWGNTTIGGEMARGYTWWTGVPVFFTLYFVPACGGKATVVASALWQGKTGRRQAKWWEEHLPVPAAGSEACEYFGRVLD